MKILSYVIAVFLFAFSFFGCDKSDNYIIAEGKYIMQGCDKLLAPYLYFEEENEEKTFTFVNSCVSSNISRGSYSIDNNILILNDDNGNIYKFTIEGKKLIFDAESSSNILEYSYFPSTVDESVFVLVE